MKKSTIVITVITFLLFGVSGISQETITKKKRSVFSEAMFDQLQTKELESHTKKSIPYKSITSKPGKSEDYYWDMVSSWIHNSNSTYTYTATGKLQERLAKDPTSDQNLYKDIFDYNSHGEIIEFSSFSWSEIDNDWVQSWGYRYQYTYENNKVTELTYQYYNVTTSSWQNSYRDLTTYDEDGYVTEVIYQYWQDGDWVNEEKEVFNEEGDEVSVYTWLEPTTWSLAKRYVDIVWRDYDKLIPASYTEQSWDYDLGWTNTYRYSSTESITERVELWEYWDGENWVKNWRDSETFDEHGNSTGYSYEYWDTENSEWVLDWGSQTEITYDANNNIIESVHKYWDYYTESFVNDQKYIYSDHQDFSGINDNNQLTNVHIFPNPAKDVINIQIDELNIKYFNLEVMNITGQSVMSSTFSDLSTSLNIDKIDKGIYILRITADNGKTLNFKLFKK